MSILWAMVIVGRGGGQTVQGLWRHRTRSDITADTLISLVMVHSMCWQISVSVRVSVGRITLASRMNRVWKSAFREGDSPFSRTCGDKEKGSGHRGYPHFTGHGSIYVCEHFWLIRTHILASRMKRVGKWAFREGVTLFKSLLRHRTKSNITADTPISLVMVHSMCVQIVVWVGPIPWLLGWKE